MYECACGKKFRTYKQWRTHHLEALGEEEKTITMFEQRMKESMYGKDEDE